MNTLNRQKKKDQFTINWSLVVLALLLFAIIIAVVFKFKDEPRFAIVKLYGKENAINMSKCYDLVFFEAAKISKGSVLAEEGDLLGHNNRFLTLYDVRKDSMQVKEVGDSIIFVNGKVNTIVISEEENLLPWFRAMKTADIANLETIYFTSKIPDSYIPYLREIAHHKPTLSLAFEEADSLNVLDDYLKKVNFFEPRFVFASVTNNQIPLLTSWKKVESLYIAIQDSIISTSLPVLPALKKLILFGDNIKAIPSSFLNNNRQLERVTLLGDFTEFEMLNPLNNLKELTINNEDDTVNIAALKNKFSQLSVLLLSGNYTNMGSFETCKNLRWLGLPANTTQSQFNTIIAQLPKLQVLELRGGNAIKNFIALQQLSKLRGLVITDTVIDKNTLSSLKQLNYLSIPVKNKEDSTYALSLEKALPGCIIVANSGACLGSGWLLVLFPAVLLFTYIFHSRSLKSTHPKISTDEVF